MFSSDVWSRWRRGGDRCGQRSLYGRVLLSGDSCCRCFTGWCGRRAAAFFLLSLFFFKCYFIFAQAFVMLHLLNVFFRLKTSETVLIKSMRMWPRSKSCTRSSCLLPPQIRVRYHWQLYFLYLCSFLSSDDITYALTLSYDQDFFSYLNLYSCSSFLRYATFNLVRLFLRRTQKYSWTQSENFFFFFNKKIPS